MKAAGKTTFLGLLDITVSNRQAKDNSFKGYIREKSSGILDVADGLCEGHFPPETPVGQIYEADYIFTFKQRFSTDTLISSVVEGAGEDWALMIKSYMDGMYNKVDDRSKFDAWKFYEYVLSSDIFIFMASCDDIRGLGTTEGRTDTSITRLIDSIVAYKEWARKSSPEAFSIVFTKFDYVNAELKRQGIDITHPDPRVSRESMTRFLEKYFRNTYRAMNFYDSVKSKLFIPCWVDLAYDKNGSVLKNNDGKAKVYVDNRTGLPTFGEYFINQLINWLRAPFMK